MSLTSNELNEILNKTRRTPNISLTPEQVEELIKDLEELQRLREKEIAEMQFDVTKYCLENIGFEYTNLKLENEKLKQDLEILDILKKGLENAGYIKIFNFNADKLEIHEIMKVRNWLNGKD